MRGHFMGRSVASRIPAWDDRHEPSLREGGPVPGATAGLTGTLGNTVDSRPPVILCPYGSKPGGPGQTGRKSSRHRVHPDPTQGSRTPRPQCEPRYHCGAARVGDPLRVPADQLLAAPETCRRHEANQALAEAEDVP